MAPVAGALRQPAGVAHALAATVLSRHHSQCRRDLCWRRQANRGRAPRALPAVDLEARSSMTSSVGSHLGIELGEYDERIRTFIPDYETMLEEAANAVKILTPRARVVVDLGIGTGALAARCLALVKSARVIGVDVDEGMLEMARRRLGGRVSVLATDFLSARLPRCDAVIASFALHHVRTRRAKAALYARCHAPLRRGGVFVSADCFLASTPRLLAVDRRAWRAHLERHYRPQQAEAYLRAWGREDVYQPLDLEVDLMRAAGFTVDVRWRRNSFAVLVGSRR